MRERRGLLRGLRTGILWSTTNEKQDGHVELKCRRSWFGIDLPWGGTELGAPYFLAAESGVLCSGLRVVPVCVGAT